MYAKLVPAKERLQIVAQNYFSTISALLQPSILIHAAAFSACAKAIFLSVNLSALPSEVYLHVAFCSVPVKLFSMTCCHDR
jgi:hypothetical protein